MAPLIGYAIGLTLRFAVWCVRTAGRLVIRHPFACLLGVLFAAAQGWIGDTLALWALLGLTVWALLSIASTRFPSARRQVGPARGMAVVAVGEGPWRTVEVRDPLQHLSARDRRRFEKACHRYHVELARKATPPR